MFFEYPYYGYLLSSTYFLNGKDCCVRYGLDASETFGKDSKPQKISSILTDDISFVRPCLQMFIHQPIVDIRRTYELPNHECDSSHKNDGASSSRRDDAFASTFRSPASYSMQELYSLSSDCPSLVHEWEGSAHGFTGTA
ncbi:uncharacterized protein CCR75_008735 [Bremia lactucae]|uniref:Uncharacterized protein n=1 Tax=Bremia lactucae TaxID=4779 RepID=A0A976FQ89_BRELC|nr:hypothetical protein CCR75_008735 [Bremia lactucae]